LKTLYGYTIPGDPKDEFVKATNSDKYFVRGDFNVARGPSAHRPPQLHRRAQRHQLDRPDDVPTPDPTTLLQQTNSTVGQLNSQFGKGVNELRLTYTRVRDHRGSPSTRRRSREYRDAQCESARSTSWPAPRTSPAATPSTRTSSS
jgi:hypothetical protein